MNPRELARAALRCDDLSVRQQVKNAARESFSWANAPAPLFRSTEVRSRAFYAAVVELFCSRSGETPPAWTGSVAGSPAPVFLVRGAKKSPALRRESMASTPEPLKKRNLYASRDYLDLA
jgi:hypothetical protein